MSTEIIMLEHCFRFGRTQHLNHYMRLRNSLETPTKFINLFVQTLICTFNLKVPKYHLRLQSKECRFEL